MDYEAMYNARMMGLLTRACTPLSEGLADSMQLVIKEAESRKRARTADEEKAFNLGVDLVLGDLLKAYAREGQWAWRATGKSNFVGEPFGYKTWLSIVPILTDLGYVEYHKGSNKKSPFGDGYVKGTASRFRATDKLIALAKSHGVAVASINDHYATKLPREVLRLKATKRGKVGGKSMSVPSNQTTEALRLQVNKINQYLTKQNLSGGDFDGYYRTFNNADSERFNWNLGGRLYSIGETTYQWMSGERRASMMINDEPVVEIDVSASGLSIYASLMGHKMPDGTDLYSVEGFARDDVKQLITMSFGQGKLPKQWPKKSNIVVDIDEVKQAVCDAIPCLLLLADSGHDWATLQYLEAEALIEAMESLHEQDIPAYGVHDSLIVPVSREQECRKALERAWKARGWPIRLK